MPRIAIIGGGISGLAVAYTLTRQGCTDFRLFEASSRLGGTVETIRQDGFVIECGPDSWVTEKPWAREVAVELGLEADIIPSLDDHRRNYLLQGGSLVPMPEAMRMMVPTDLSVLDDSPLFSEAARLAYREEANRASELKAYAASRSPDADESVANFVQRHFGSEVTEKIAGPLLAGIFGGDIRKLSARSVMAPFLRMERDSGSLVLALQQTGAQRSSRSVFTSLKGGVQSLTDEMSKSLTAECLMLGSKVESLTHGSGGKKWKVRTSRSSDDFDVVILATPVHITRKLLRGALDLAFGEEVEALLDIEASSAITIAFCFNRAQSKELEIPVGFGFLAADGSQELPEPRLLACTFVDQKFAYRAPEGCTLLRAFYGGAAAPKLMGDSDEELSVRARAELSETLGKVPEAKITVVRRWPRSLPQYLVGHAVRVSRLQRLMSEVPNLYLVGNAFHGVGLPDLVRDGQQLAKGIVSSGA